MTAKAIRLSGNQKYRINKWIEANHKTFDGLTFPEIAAMAQKALLFPITASHVKSAKEWTGCQWKSGGRGGNRTSTPETRRVNYADMFLVLAEMEKVLTRIGADENDTAPLRTLSAFFMKKYFTKDLLEE